MIGWVTKFMPKKTIVILILLLLLLLLHPKSLLASIRSVVANVSAYTSVETGNNVGAWGDTLREGDCAADDLLRNTIVTMDGQQYVVRDKIGGNYRNRIDIYMSDDVSRAMQFGRQFKEITVEANNDD
jgi:3D (Asp-Asp-Asp) domain-containing protein